MADTVFSEFSRILVIRRDNIGDLVCTTPLLGQLRRSFPQVQLDVLANSYNAPVLEHHPDVDRVFVYVKNKHRPKGMSVLVALWRRLCLLFYLRRQSYDLVILAQASYQWHATKFAVFINPRHILGYREEGAKGSHWVDLTVPQFKETVAVHEVEKCLHLLTALGINKRPLPLKLGLSGVEQQDAQQLRQQWLGTSTQNKVFGIHVSARLVSQRWQVDQFAELINTLLLQCTGLNLVLFWSPGRSDNSFHPGDDAVAEAIQRQLTDLSVKNKGDYGIENRFFAFSTSDLRTLMQGFSALDLLLCSDGGAMHIGAALQLPIVCFFGESDPQAWHPWQVRHQVLRAPSCVVADIPVAQVVAAIQSQILQVDTVGSRGSFSE